MHRLKRVLFSSRDPAMAKRAMKKGPKLTMKKEKNKKGNKKEDSKTNSKKKTPSKLGSTPLGVMACPHLGEIPPTTKVMLK